MIRTAALVFGTIATLAAPSHAADPGTVEQATRSAEIAGHSLSKVHRWLHEIALPRIDAETGLYIADGKWNYRDTAADCYPFLVWAAWATDRTALNGPVRSVLNAEQALCNRLDRIPVPYDLNTGAQQELEWDDMVFQASEYVKDGLIAMVEITGKDAWFDRMRAIQDDLWNHARVDTPFGPIVSTNIEVNGEQLQALARLYTMTGDARYLEWAERIADYYFADKDFVPTRLRDHGCEIIGGLGLLQAVLPESHAQKAEAYAGHLKRVYDTILEQGCNADGMMYNHLTARDGRNGLLSDGWGYNYVGLLCYDMATGTRTYEPNVRATLANLAKPAYKNYAWEGESIDGYADSLEGAIYLLNRVPVEEGFTWVDRETVENAVDHPERLENGDLWGTMKLQSNGVRTVLMHALMHTQGLTAHPWQQGLELGAATESNGLVIVLRSETDYDGHLEFDIPRHRLYMGFERDWPRMNTLPEWFTVEPGAHYTVSDGATETVYTGQQLYHGLRVSVRAGESRTLHVTPHNTD